MGPAHSGGASPSTGGLTSHVPECWAIDHQIWWFQKHLFPWCHHHMLRSMISGNIRFDLKSCPKASSVASHPRDTARVNRDVLLIRLSITRLIVHATQSDEEEHPGVHSSCVSCNSSWPHSPLSRTGSRRLCLGTGNGRRVSC